MESWSWVLPYQLYLWCEKQGIEATRGEYMAYKEYIRPGRESFYIRLNDRDHTMVEATAKSYGMLWAFAKPSVSREEIERLAAQDAAPGDPGEE